MQIKELIGEQLYVAQLDDTCQTLAERMDVLDVHALPVVDEDRRPLGFVSSSDLTPDLPSDTAIADVMTDQVYSIDIDDAAKEAARMMRDLGVHHLVVTERDAAVGIVSSFDLLRVIEES